MYLPAFLDIWHTEGDGGAEKIPTNFASREAHGSYSARRAEH